jgi:hypothetical protein
MILNPTKTVRSEKYPEVSFTVKALNVIERARRDMSMAAARSECLRLNRERDALLKALLPRTDGDFSGYTYAEIETLAEADKQRVYLLLEQSDLVHNSEILPAEIRAALVSVEGIESGGQPATIETVLSAAPSDLIDEIHAACISASGLTGEQEKNSPSPGSLVRQGDGATDDSTAPSAA